MPARKKTTASTRKKTAASRTSRQVTAAELPPPTDPELLRKIELCETACQGLLSSRNKLILATAISWIISVALIVYITSRVPAIHIENTVKPRANSVSDQARPKTEQDPVAYIKKIRRLLEEDGGNDAAALAEAKPTISTVLDYASRANNSPLLDQDQKKREIIEFVYRWALAWELKNTDEYFSYYSAQFDPGTKADSLNGWKTLKRYYIGRPDWIKVKVDHIEITALDANTATVTFSQAYEIPTYADITQKTLRLVHDKDGWKILRESGVIQEVDLKGQG